MKYDLKLWININLLNICLVCVLFWCLSDDIHCCLFVNAFISGIAQLRPYHHLSRAELALFSPGVRLSVWLAYITLSKPPSNLES